MKKYGTNYETQHLPRHVKDYIGSNCITSVVPFMGTLYVASTWAKHNTNIERIASVTRFVLP